MDLSTLTCESQRTYAASLCERVRRHYGSTLSGLRQHHLDLFLDLGELENLASEGGGRKRLNRELPRLLRKDSDFDEYRQSLDETGRTLREWLWNPEKRQAFLSALTEELLELTHESGGLAGNTNLLNIKRLLQLRLPPKFRRFKDRDALLVRNQKSLVFFLKHYFDVYVQVDVLDKLIERRLSEKFRAHVKRCVNRLRRLSPSTPG